MARVTLTNDGPGDRGMYDANQQPITIRAGETRENIELNDADIAYLREMDERARKQNKREQLRVVQPAEQQGTDEVGETNQRVDLTDKPQGESDIVEQVRESHEKLPAQRAKRLLDQQSSLEHASFMSEAKDILGDNWPGGTPKKTAIVDLLKEAARG
jgi:hypothetical protein